MFAWRNSDAESQNIKIVNLNPIGGLNLVGFENGILGWREGIGGWTNIASAFQPSPN